MPSIADYLIGVAAKLKKLLDDCNTQLVTNGRRSVEKLSEIPPLLAINTSDATATANDIFKGKTAYVKDEKITGTVEKETIGVKPSYSIQEVKASEGNVLEKVTVSALEYSVVDTVSATATASDIFKGKSAFANGIKVVGTVERETKTITSGSGVQEITPSNGNVLEKVIINPSFTKSTSIPNGPTIVLEDVKFTPDTIYIWTQFDLGWAGSDLASYTMISLSASYDSDNDKWNIAYANAYDDYICVGEFYNPDAFTGGGNFNVKQLYLDRISIAYSKTDKTITITIAPNENGMNVVQYKWCKADNSTTHWMVTYKNT